MFFAEKDGVGVNKKSETVWSRSLSTGLSLCLLKRRQRQPNSGGRKSNSQNKIGQP